MSRTRAALTALLLTPVLLATGCSDDDPEPRFAPPSSLPPESPSPTAASGPAAPELPPAAKGTDAAAAEAFVKHYWAMVNYAQSTGAVDGLQTLSLKCGNCDSGSDFIEDVYSGGGTIRGGEGTPQQFDTSFIKLKGEWWAVVKYRLALTPQDVDAVGTADDKHYPGGDRRINMYLQPVDDAWVVRSLGTQ